MTRPKAYQYGSKGRQRMLRKLWTLQRADVRRWIGVAAVALLVHAVAIDTLHHHASHATHGAALALSAPDGGSAKTVDGPGSCPACQVHQNPAANMATETCPLPTENEATRFQTRDLAEILRATDTSPPDRAPPRFSDSL